MTNFNTDSADVDLRKVAAHCGEMNALGANARGEGAIASSVEQ